MNYPESLYQEYKEAQRKKQKQETQVEKPKESVLVYLAWGILNLVRVVAMIGFGLVTFLAIASGAALNLSAAQAGRLGEVGPMIALICGVALVSLLATVIFGCMKIKVNEKEKLTFGFYVEGSD